MKKTTICFLILMLAVDALVAQQGTIEIYGKVVERNSRQPLEFATIKLLEDQTNLLINGTTTLYNGLFSLKTEATNFSIEISFIGFMPTIIKEIVIRNGKADLGTIALSEDIETLGEVVVQGEKSQTIFKLDKRVFNVGQDLSSTGASVLEVLNNVPSVTVSIEGQIRLRGSAGVQILINGKPSVLASEKGNALGTLTADMIEQIEVITNPSAKHDAEGTAGIINIVLKKEEKRGLNGSVTLNAGSPNNHSLGVSINNRMDKFNLFSQLGAGHRTFPEKYRMTNRDLLNGSGINSKGESDKNETFFNIILGTDYHINRWNVLTLAGHFGYELEKEFSNTNFSLFNAQSELDSQWNRDETTEATNPKWQYELQYKKQFSDQEEHKLLFSAIGSYFGKEQSSVFDNTPIYNAETLTEQQKTYTDFFEGKYTFKLDYTRPVNEKVTLETGAQYLVTDVTNDFSVSNQIGNSWVTDPDMTNVFEYDQKVLGIYGTGAFEGDKYGVKIGLRMENTDLNTLLINTEHANHQLYTNLFPTVHSSYKLMDNFSLQAGYSRRISRPGLWNLNPFTNIRNNFNIRTGNPLLQPEFTDSYEVNGIFDHGPFSISAAVYYRYTTDVVENVSTFQNNVSLTRPENVGTNRATGLELNTKFNPINWWSLNGDFNYNYYNREGTFESDSFDFNSDQWSSRMTSKFKLPAGIDFELTGNYRSSYQTFQRDMSDNLFFDLGMRKKIMNGKTIFNLSVRDVFASRIFESETHQTSFYLYDRRLRGRFITFGISYGFGKGEAMEFSGQKRF
jgi:outer membrane receptor protein involved in Fe transport